MILPSVQYSENDHPLIFDAKKQFVGKAARQNPTKTLVVGRIPKRIDFQCKHRLSNFVQQIVS